MGRKKASVEAQEPETAKVSADPKKRNIDFKWVPIDQIIPNSWNVNTQDEITFNILQDEIAEVGLIDPIEVVALEEDVYVILGGEHRWRAAKNLGFEEVPCILLTDTKWKDQDLQKFVTVRLNVIHGKVDSDKFVVLYNELAQKYGADSMQRLMGYADTQQFQKMLGWVKKGLKQSLPKEMGQQIEDATKEVKSVADLSKIIQELFNKYGETVNQSFMVFTYGKQQHLYISMGTKLRAAMSRLMTYCTVAKKDINDVIAPMIQEGVKALAIELEATREGKAGDLPKDPLGESSEDSKW